MELQKITLASGPNGKFWLTKDGGLTWKLAPIKARRAKAKESQSEHHSSPCSPPGTHAGGANQ